MKLKNHYVGLCVVWIFITFCDSFVCGINFMRGNLSIGFLYLAISVLASFVSGIFFVKAKNVAKYNKCVENMERKLEILAKKKIDLLKAEENKPFKEFDT
jgi:hypothetical protein